MNNITDLIYKLPCVTLVSIELTRRMGGNPACMDIVHSLQLGYYWFKTANTQMATYSDGILTSEIDEKDIPEIIIPTLIGIPEYFKYIQEYLEPLIKETEQFLQEAYFPEPVKYKLEQGYNHIVEASFNLDILTKYYGVHTRQREHQQGS